MLVLANRIFIMNSFIKKNWALLLSLALLLPIYFLGIRGVIDFPNSLGIGTISINLYSIAILSGIGTSAFLFDRYKNRYKSLKQIQVDEALIYMFVPAIILARMWHVATDWHLYSESILNIAKVWNGGLGIYGAIIGGLWGAYYYSRKNEIDFVKAVDLLAVFYPIGQVLGRFGNFFNQELYGPTTELPWGFYVRTEDGYFHPSFLYEQLGLSCIFLLLVYIYNKKILQIGTGSLTLLSLAGYAGVRFLVDFYRVEPNILGDFSTAQVASLIIVVISTLLLIKKHGIN